MAEIERAAKEPLHPSDRQAQPQPRVAAFFDLDCTLLLVNSGALWMRRERRMGRISFWQLLEGMLYLAAYKLNALDFERVMAKALSTVAGEHEETVRRWTHEWYRQEVAPHVAPGARAVLAQHRHQGHALVLLTSSSPYESEIATEHLGLEAFLCSRYEVQDGILTGAPVRPLCYGGGKVVWAERFAQERGVDLKASYFYSDSSTDVEMLERVGHPRVVSPDLRLRRLAKRRGWPILDWRSP